MGSFRTTDFHYFSLADLICRHGSQHDSRVELFISPVRTIGLVYRLPANILQLTLRSAVGHIGHKLFLRELRRSTIDRELAQLLSRLIEAIVPLCVLLLQDAFLLPPPSSLLPSSFLRSPETHSVSSSRRDYLKSLLFRR